MQQLRKVRFLAEVPTAYSETAMIVGSAHCLGKWSPLHGHLLQTSHLLYPYWRSIVEVELPCELDIEFKLVVQLPDESFRWESGPNHSIRVEGSMTVKCQWERNQISAQPYDDTFAEERERKKSMNQQHSGRPMEFGRHFGKPVHQYIGKVLYISGVEAAQYWMLDHGKLTSLCLQTSQQLEGVLQECSLVYTSSRLLFSVPSMHWRKVCLVDADELSYEPLSGALQLRMLVFSTLLKLQLFIDRLSKLNCRIHTFLGNKVVLTVYGMQTLLLSSNTLSNSPTSDVGSVTAILTRYSTIVSECELQAQQHIVLGGQDQSDAFQWDFIVPVLTTFPEQPQLSQFIRLSAKFRQSIVVCDGVPPPEHGESFPKNVSVVGRSTPHFKRAGSIDRLIAEVRQVLSRLNLSEVLQVLDNQPRHYLILVAKSIRLSEVVLDCIETELRGNPQLRELQFRRTNDSLCVFGPSEISHIQAILAGEKSNTALIIGRPSFPQFFSSDLQLKYSPSVEHVLRAMAR